MELLALHNPIKKPPRSDERDGELFCGTPLTLTLHTYADRFSEHGGVLTIPNSHGFKTLTVDAYIGSSSYSASPRITVANVDYSRPAVGTVFNIEGKAFTINTFDSATWTSVGITVTLT